jgi:hypothetical protein
VPEPVVVHTPTMPFESGSVNTCLLHVPAPQSVSSQQYFAHCRGWDMSDVPTHVKPGAQKGPLGLLLSQGMHAVAVFGGG